MHNNQPVPERIEKPAQIAREGVSTDRKGETGWFDYEGQSVHVWLRDYRGHCAQHIYSPLGNGHSIPGQCSRVGKLELNGFLFCKQHYPPNERAKRREREAARQAEYERNRAVWKKEADHAKMLKAALEAIKQIAAGHNDPRGLALEVLGTTLKDPSHG